jgi:formylmethanofuran dehydrogenase subunit C
MRRGLLWIGKNSGEFTGARMLAGTIIISGNLGSYAGMGLRRGSIIAGHLTSMVPGFRSAGYADAEWMRMELIALHTMGMTIPTGWQHLRSLRFTGDHLDLGKGELVVYELAE